MRPVPIFPEVINEQKTASGNYKYWTGIGQFRSYVKTGLSLFAFLRLPQMQRARILMKKEEIDGYPTSFRMLYGQWRALCRCLGLQSKCCVFTQYFYPFLALISVENDTLKVITFDILSINF